MKEKKKKSFSVHFTDASFPTTRKNSIDDDLDDL
jgi:hypothetical protein